MEGEALGKEQTREAPSPRRAGDSRLRRAAVALEAVVAAALGLACLQARLINLGVYSGSYPEGIRAAQLQLMAAGYRPFADIFSDQGPWLLHVLYPGYAAFGGSLVGMRAGVVVASLLGLVGAYWTVRQMAGPIGGLAGLLLLGLSPIYLQFSRLAVAEVLALAPAILAVGCAVRFSRDPRLRWLSGAGLLLAFSLLIKPITLGTAMPVALGIWLGGGARWRNVLLVGAITAAAVLVGVLLVGLPEIMQQIVQFRAASREVEGWSLASNVSRLRVELRDEGLAMLVLAAAGAVVALRRRATWPLVLWGLSSIGVVLAHSPLHSKHFAIIVVPLGMLAALAVGSVAGGAVRAARRTTRLLAIGGLVGAVALWAMTLPAILGRDLKIVTSDDLFDHDRARPWYGEAAETLRRVVGPEEFVITDHAYLAFAADRLIPPSLVEASATRVRARSLTDGAAIATTEAYKVRAVLLWADKLNDLKQYRAWLTEHFVPVKVWAAEGDTRPVLWLRNDERLDASREALRAEPGWKAAGSQLGTWRLQAYRLHSQRPDSLKGSRPGGTDGDFASCLGDTPSVTIEWVSQAAAPPDSDVVLALWRDAADRRALDEEREPLLGGIRRPAWLFWVGALPVSQQTGAGSYQLSVALSGGREPPYPLGGFGVLSC